MRRTVSMRKLPMSNGDLLTIQHFERKWSNVSTNKHILTSLQVLEFRNRNDESFSHAWNVISYMNTVEPR